MKALKSEAKRTSTIIALKLMRVTTSNVEFKTYLLHDVNSEILSQHDNEKFNDNANYEDIIPEDELVNMASNPYDHHNEDAAGKMQVEFRLSEHT